MTSCQDKGYWARSTRKHVQRSFSTIFLLCFVCINLILFANFFSHLKWLLHYQLHVCQQNLGPLSVYIQYYVCSHYILIGYVSINCKHWRLCIRVVLLSHFLANACSGCVSWAACQLMSQSQHSGRAQGTGALCSACLRWQSGSQGCGSSGTAGRVQRFPWQPRPAECRPWAAAADPDWYWVGLSWLFWGEAARPPLFHPAVCAQVKQPHCTDLLHFMYFLLA